MSLKFINAKKEAIFNLISNLNENAKRVSKADTRKTQEFMISTTNLESLYQQYNKLTDDSNNLEIENNPEFIPDFDKWISFESLFCQIKETRETVLENRRVLPQTGVSSNKEPGFTIKLPPIELPKFDGKPETWPLFYEAFKSNIHLNPNLNNSQKIQYLVGKLSGKALAVLSGILPTEENYLTIWNSLVQKYQDKRLLGTFYLNNIFDIKVASNNANQLNNFIERFSSSYSALKQLNITDLSDFVILHIALKRLDPQLIQLFENSVNKDIPSCTDLVEYIRQQVKILERINSHIKTTSPHTTHNRVHSATHSFALTDFKSSNCGICNKLDHLKLYECQIFKNMTPKVRFDKVKELRHCINCLRPNHTSTKCKSSNSCTICNKRHHTLLHFEPKINLKNDTTSPSPSSTTPSQSITMHTQASLNLNTTVLLSTAQVYAFSNNGNKTIIRCLIDSASQNNLITTSCCKKLNLNIIPLNNSYINTVGSIKTPMKGYVTLTIQSRISFDKYNIILIVVDTITEKLPITNINTLSLNYLKNILLADESWNVPGEIEAILGAQIFPNLLLTGHITPPSNLIAPQALETTLGYILIGEVPINTILNNSFSHFNLGWTFGPITNENLNENITKFWNLEEIPNDHIKDSDEIFCENLYKSSSFKDSSGRYIVELPFKQDPSLLGNSHVMAKRRFIFLERKLKRNSELRQAYNEVIKDYLDKGYLSEISFSEENINSGYFIPHHAVVRLDKTTTKVRVVLDASAQTDTGVSLNDILHTGPNLQANLFSLLLNFRLFPIAITADIKQMYLRILLSEKHRKYQKILFRFNDSEPIRLFQFNSVAFGLKSSPYLAMRTIKQLADDECDKFPLVSEVAKREFYMDDLITSVSSIKTGINLSKGLISLFKCGGLDLIKWASNSKELLKEVPESYRAVKEFSDGECLKILGLKWLPVSDIFTFTSNLTESKDVYTKRIVLSTIARLFDVLGLVAPVILYAKLLIQELWLIKSNWDDKLPEDILKRFIKFKNELPQLTELKIPRHLGVADGCNVNILAFGDASIKAYGCCVYMHVSNLNLNISVNLICAKSKIAPLKTLSLARLELCAALLLSKLVRHILDTYGNRYKINNIFAFSDSTIALSWIHSSPHRWQTFVANRVGKIQENLAPTNFYHINGIENPSDCVSRGLLPSQLINHSLWWNGPSWAHFPIEDWPIKPFDVKRHNLEIPEIKREFTTLISTSNESLVIYNLSLRVSSWIKLLNIVVYILRFIKRIKSRNVIKASDLEIAEIVIFKELQKKYFKKELNNINNKDSLSLIFRKLDIFLDDKGLIRVGGRLSNANIPFENRYPILLPGRNHIVNLLIDHFHCLNCHAGSYLLMSLLRQRYWIISARNIIRQRIRLCNFCFKILPKFITPKMANLPPARVQEAKAFTHTGVDYAGPINITMTRRRGIKSQKAYICLFICLTTKAIHIELASDLSSEIFLDAFKRFISRRGPISCLYSDNATNFIGAKRRLNEIYNFLYANETKQSFQREFNIRKIEWKMIPPSAPHFGGIWEANLKSVKTHLYRVIGKQLLSYEELNTILIQIECLLNSRPLCLLTEEPQPEILTPAHFLMSTPLQFLPFLSNSDQTLKGRKRLLDNLIKSYWKKWHLEYLHTLQLKQKWNKSNVPIKIGTIVLIKQDDVPPLHWPLGVIEQVYPGMDGVIRVALVRSQNGIFKRPVVKLCPIPTQ